MTTKRMATFGQTWALFAITKKDYRDEGLTYDEASKMISDLNKKNGYKGKAKTTAKAGKKKVKARKAKPSKPSAVALLEKAEEAGSKAMADCTPTPMVVEQHVNMFDDGSPVEKSWFVEGGVCGFAWVNFPCKNTATRKFINALKKAGVASADRNSGARIRRDDYAGGFTYWVHHGGQSMQKKEAFARAFARVLSDAGILAYNYSRMD